MYYSLKRHIIIYSLSTIISFVFSLSIILIIYKFLIYKINLFNILILLILFSFNVFFSFYFLTKQQRNRLKILNSPLKSQWDLILNKHVHFYVKLDNKKKQKFKKCIELLLNEKKIYGVNCLVDDKLQALIAANIIIPVFHINNWEHDSFNEILVYPSYFDYNDNLETYNNDIVGMIDPKTSTLIISKPALYSGFQSKKENQNIGIHEFIHKLNNQDINIEGIPALIINKRLITRWLKIIKIESKKIANGESDINNIALNNNADFYKITSKYFFNNPIRLKRLHPDLYNILVIIFKQNLSSLIKSSLRSIFPFIRRKIKKKSLCPCGSKKIFEKCCFQNIYKN